MGALDPRFLISLDLTHVQYHPEDPWGAHLALVTLSPVLVLTAYVTVFLHRRETMYVNAFIGHILCEMLNSRLKNIIRQERPTDFLGSGYGMPSSHSQFSGFFCAFWLSHLIVNHPFGSRDSHTSLPSRRVDHAVFMALVLLVSGLTCYSRFHLLYHSAAQIYAGLSIGLVFGAVYYYLLEVLPRSWRPGGLFANARHFYYTNSVSRALRLRDSWSVWKDGGVDAEYNAWLKEFAAKTRRTAGGVMCDGTQPAHVRTMLLALSEADQCEGVDTAFSVGCALAVPSALLETPEMPLDALPSVEPLALFTGFSRELPGNTHAEECALEKLRRYCQRTPEAQSASARNAADHAAPLSLLLYTTMEPCSERLSGNRPCVQRILEFNAIASYSTAAWLSKAAMGIPHNMGAARLSQLDRTLRRMRIVLVVQGVREPEDFVKCQGQRQLHQGGIEVIQARPTASPMALGMACPNLTSVPLRVDRDQPTQWLEDVCLRMAKKGHRNA